MHIITRVAADLHIRLTLFNIQREKKGKYSVAPYDIEADIMLKIPPISGTVTDTEEDGIPVTKLPSS